MIGFRGAARYVSESFKPCWEMECKALKYVRDEMGFTNIEIMIPFVRTLDEAKNVVEALAANGLVRGENGLRLIMMCELPSNAVLADEFLEYFDGFSIGSNDMTQLTLGLDRDSSLIAKSFDERDPAVKKMLSMAISACKAKVNMSASVARALLITPTWRSGCLNRASAASPSTRTQLSIPGYLWPGRLPNKAGYREDRGAQKSQRKALRLACDLCSPPPTTASTNNPPFHKLISHWIWV